MEKALDFLKLEQFVPLVNVYVGTVLCLGLWGHYYNTEAGTKIAKSLESVSIFDFLVIILLAATAGAFCRMIGLRAISALNWRVPARSGLGRWMEKHIVSKLFHSARSCRSDYANLRHMARKIWLCRTGADPRQMSTDELMAISSTIESFEDSRRELTHNEVRRDITCSCLVIAVILLGISVYRIADSQFSMLMACILVFVNVVTIFGLLRAAKSCWEDVAFEKGVRIAHFVFSHSPELASEGPSEWIPKYLKTIGSAAATSSDDDAKGNT